MKGLYVVTPDWDDTAKLVAKTEQALKGGASLVQYRHKTADMAQKREQAKAIQKICAKYGKPFIINDTVELAVELNTDGAHVGEKDMPVAEARKMLATGKILGASCYGIIQLARNAVRDGADYVAFGGFYKSRVKQYEVTTPLSIVADWKKERPDVPVCVIGGMVVENSKPLVQLGADMVAVVSGVYFQDDCEAAAKEFMPLFK